jgi:hypothetical protein
MKSTIIPVGVIALLYILSGNFMVGLIAFLAGMAIQIEIQDYQYTRMIEDIQSLFQNVPSSKTSVLQWVHRK